MSVLSKLYSRIFWKNYPSTESPLDEVDLNRLDAAIDGIDDRLIQVDTVKFDKTSASGLLAEVALNSETGDLTLTYYSGSKKVIHTNLAKIAVNISYDAVNERLVLHMPDGTDTYVDMSALITQFEFLDSDTIAFEVTADGKVKAGIRTGSVTEDMLRPNFLADVKVQAAKAEKSATQAASSETGAAYDAKLAQSYSVGGSGVREGDATDNARYYREQAQTAADSASGSASTASAAAATATDQATAAGTSAASAESSAGNAAASAQTAAAQAESASGSASTATSAAQTATAQAVAAGTSATQAAGSANLARSYAVGSAGAVREGDATDNAKYYKEQAERIAEGLKGSLLPMGTITFAELPDTSNAGYMFNISDEFTTTARFKEGAGHVIPAGTNVYYTADGYWDCMAGSPVTGVKGSAESSYRRGNVNITPEDLGITVVNNTHDSEKSVKYAQGATNDSNGNKICDTYLPLAGGKVEGALQVGDKVHIWSDTEGGNIRLDAHSSGYYCEMDMCAGNGLRAYIGNADTEVLGSLVFDAAGLGIDGRMNASAFYTTTGKAYIFEADSHGELKLVTVDNQTWTISPWGSTNTLFIHNSETGKSVTIKKDGSIKADGSVTGSAFNGTTYWADVANKPTAYPPSDHTHDYLPLSGGTVSGDMKVNGSVSFGDPYGWIKNYFHSASGKWGAGNGVMIQSYSDVLFTDGGDSNTLRGIRAKQLSTNDTVYEDGKIKTTYNGGYLNLQADVQIQCRNYNDTAWVPIAASGYPNQSSRKYKKNIQDISEEQARSLLDYRVVTYDYIEESSGKNCMGLIAEEVADICEWPVFRNAAGEPDGLDYSRFVPQLIKMVQLQQEEINSLKSRLAEVKTAE